MTEDERPDPDKLLSKIVAEEKEKLTPRGKLKIFFGSSAGVGKTYAMLSAAHELKKQGIDVVVGIIETHSRPETEKLREGLEELPSLKIFYRGVTLTEFNLDAALMRKPALLLVDELAHSNAPGLRHAKRWNDVVELLEAGIDVFTTLNVQHIESLSDLVAGTTGVWVKETVPDSIFDCADEIILVDIDADELLKRLSEGKVYVAEQAKARAASNFFKKNNLIALRELALRRTADRVDAQMNAYCDIEGLGDRQPIAEKILVCVGPDPLSAKLVRTARRMATPLKASWEAVTVDNGTLEKDENARRAVDSIARMVERNGGKMVILQGEALADEILAYAHEQLFTKIIVGKPIKPSWINLLRGVLADQLIHKSGPIDIYVVTGATAPGEDSGAPWTKFWQHFNSHERPLAYLIAILVVALCTAVGVASKTFLVLSDQPIVYFTGLVLVATILGRGPSMLCALLSAFSYNFFFTEPLYTFGLHHRSYAITFFLMLLSGYVIGFQTSRLREQILTARARERRTQSLYRLTRELTSTRGRAPVSTVVAHAIEEMLDVDVTVWMPIGLGHPVPVLGKLPESTYSKELGVLQWCYDNAKIAGKGTQTLSGASGLYLPLVSSNGVSGVLGVFSKKADSVFTVGEISSLETYASLLSTALERVRAGEIAAEATVDAETEKMRNALLSAISHDLRAPLATISTSARLLVSEGEKMPRETVTQMIHAINDESLRLSRLVSNLLDVTSLESGTIKINKKAFSLPACLPEIFKRLEPNLFMHKVAPMFEADLPDVWADPILIEQVLTNLLENAARYTPVASIITVSASRKDDEVLVSVSDNGAGIPPGAEKKIFDKFYTITRADESKGSGLGLSICEGIIKAHGGRIWAENRPHGGARFTFTLPVAKIRGAGESKD